MLIYVAGALADVETVRSVQTAVIRAGHELTLDWTRASDAALTDYESQPAAAASVASADLDAVLAAEAVLVVASEHEGRGMYVELGAALARASAGELEQVAVIGSIHHQSVFFYHPAVTRWVSVEEWLASLDRARGCRTA
ncbi:hypothetical protein I601_2458 [Nocardioides dokdonensis FR1436]|uniref:Nucleoside 2-deoxyribosyltransferase n=1 Tax=Nocardioides dokdonensis FR1436 TaxID=1300347 RepID=A0A1A9GLA3_9ACTN|nr:hypothetical protein [Nocardioides dokdonensis]ANH38876.1 hypothetical protein I601_2458 [Nocardioides dokdonensis FR1436]